MTMVERVARALFATEWANKGHSWEQEAVHHAYWLTAARAAIAAMREPTMEMLRATYEQRVAPDQPAGQRKAIWQAMIDSALSTSVPATSDPSGLDMPDLG